MDYQDLSREELIMLVDRLVEEKRRRRYGLVWEEQEEGVEKILRGNYPVLAEVKEREIINDKTKPMNLLIEGDNLHSLNTLLYTHREKVNVIYIDPPYNTGNKDFIYNDKMVDKEDTWRHSKWLSFMAKRLRIARELLSDDGVIFISIDDNEQAQLKLLCDEVFGEGNVLGQFVWEKNPNPTFLNKYIRSSHEYVYCYSKCKDRVSGLYETHVYEKQDDSQPLQNKGNPMSVLEVKEGEAELNFIENGIVPEGVYGKIKLLDDVEVVNGANANCFRIEGTFRFRQEYFESAVRENRKLIFKTDKMSPRLTNNIIKSKDFAPKSILKTQATTQVGVNEVNNILGESEFSYPKPVDLIKGLLRLNRNVGAVVLDFFAGSGTTGHAVMELNKEDGGNRQFILCTNNENNICEDVTYERLKRVIIGYTTPKGKEVAGLGGNLKYFKTGFIEKDQDEEDLKNQFIDKSLELLSIKEDTYEKLIDNDSFKMNGGVDKVIGLYMDIDTNYTLLDDIQGMFDEYNVGVKKLFMPDQIDIDNDSKIEDLRNSGIEIHRVPRKIIDILEGWRK